MHVSRRLVALAPALMLAACVTTTDTVVTDTSCAAFEPIRWSVADTDETIRQVRGHNAAWGSLCASGE